MKLNGPTAALEMLEAKDIVEKVGNKQFYANLLLVKKLKSSLKGWTGDKLQVVIDEWGQNPKTNIIEEDFDEDDIEDPKFMRRILNER